jgi:uncharacterized membrane protein
MGSGLTVMMILGVGVFFAWVLEIVWMVVELMHLEEMTV